MASNANVQGGVVVEVGTSPTTHHLVTRPGGIVRTACGLWPSKIVDDWRMFDTTELPTCSRCLRLAGYMTHVPAVDDEPQTL